MEKRVSYLSDDIISENYNLFIKPDLKKFIFKGEVEIETKIKKPTSQIILNSSELKIKNSKIISNNITYIPKISLNQKHELLTLSLNKKISGKVKIEIEFQGTHNDKLAGFYRSSYTNKKGRKKYLATSQFEAPYARKAFPCFDQPDKKATFTLSLLIPKEMKAISNMPIASQKPQQKKTLVTFQKTPKMSTYLLYIGVGEFEFLTTTYKNKIIRVVTTPGKAHQGKFALEATKKFLLYFENYSKIDYPLPKLDLVAIPDFNAGAMENWGAITFREIILLYDKKKTSTKVKKRIAEVIAHELWHQWSGNLVTMHWWEDLWLNESFATYMAYKAVNHFFPEWKIFEDFVNYDTAGALNADALKTTHPIEVKVNSPNEIEQIFDEISYGKGGSVLRMLDSYLGEETFRQGVSNYLKKFKYKNAVASDLWNELAKISNAPIKEIMESWIKQGGFPLIKAEKEKDKIKILQEKFSHDLREDNTVWKIPLTIKTDSNKIIKHLVTKKKETLKLSQDLEYFKLNENQEGFYRVKYSYENLEKLKLLVTEKKLSVFDRWGLQNDLFNLCLMDHSKLSAYLDFIKCYQKESSPFILEDIYINIGKIYIIFSQESFWDRIWNKLKEHIKEPFQKSLEKLTWNFKENESQQDALLRSLSIGYLAFVEDPEVIKIGLQRFRNPENIHADIKGIIYSIVAKHGGKDAYKKLIMLYEKTKSPEEKVKILSAIYKSKDLKILKNALDFALSKNVRIQDLRTVFSVIPSNPELRPVFFDWAKRNWKKLEPLKKAHFVFIGLLEAIITSYLGREKEIEIRNFLNSKNTGYEKIKAKSFEIMQINTKFLENNKKILEEYLN